MSQKIAVAIIHGAGSQGPEFAGAMVAKLKQSFAKLLPSHHQSIADKLAIKPIYWADILAKKQRILWNSVLDDDSKLGFGEIRQFIMNFGADAVAYQPGATRREVYDRVHHTVADALNGLAEACGPQAPLCIIGHSIGTVITHNYLFDLGETIIANKKIEETITPLESSKTLVLLYMMGSPLALWSLRYDNYRAIPFPGSKVSTLFPQLRPKWVNFYDKDDILAYPLRSLSSGHRQLAEQGLLIDTPVNVGNILTSWNPLSHLAYWTSDDITDTIAQDLFEVWRKLNPSANAR
jgi:hypothetical protein